MKTQSEFAIPYLGLSNGNHHFSFILDNSFFSRFEMSKIEEGHFRINVQFDKQDRMVVLIMECTGYFMAPCDRCLSEIQVSMEFEDRVILKMTELADDNSDPEIYYLDPKTSHIDLSPFMNEAIHLNLPIKNVRNCVVEDEIYCDKEVLKSLSNTTHNTTSSTGKNPWEELGKLNLE